MVRNDYPRDGDFGPPTDYTEHSPLNTRERKELKKSTSKNLGDLNRELGGDFNKVTVLGTIKTFDKGYGLRIRDDNGDKIGTAYKGEQVRIFGRKKRVADSEGILRDFLKIGVYNNRGEIDEKRSGWVAEDFVEVDQKHIDTLIRNLETSIEKNKKPKPREMLPEPVKLEVKIPDMETNEQNGIPEWLPSEPLTPLIIRDEKTEPVQPKVTPKPPEPRIKLPELKPLVKIPESTQPEVKKPETPTVETPEKAPEAESMKHIIAEGDTLGKIADKYNVSKNDLMAENDMWSGHPIYIGETLVIPPAVKEAPTTAPNTPAKEVPSTPSGKPEVKPESVKPETPKPIPEIKKPATVKTEEKKPELRAEPITPQVKPEPVKPVLRAEPIKPVSEVKKSEPVKPGLRAEPITPVLVKPQLRAEPIQEQKPKPEPANVIKNSLGIVLEKDTIKMLEKMSQNAKITYERVLPLAQKQYCNFIIADKPAGMVYIFNQFGQSVRRFPALYGQQEGDKIPVSAHGKLPIQLREDEHITPSGIFAIGPQYFNEAMDTDLLDIGEDFDQDGTIDTDSALALHPIYLGKPWQNRPLRLATRTPDDNRISKGCINVSERNFSKWISPCFSAGGIIGITPDAVADIDKYVPPYVLDDDGMITKTSN